MAESPLKAHKVIPTKEDYSFYSTLTIAETKHYHINEINHIANLINGFGVKTILLKGELGSGKTTLSRAIIRNLLNDENLSVTSPTFSIVNIYNEDIAHFDLYRVQSVEELYEIGTEEMLSNFTCIIEWPQVIENTDLMKNREFIRIAIESVDELEHSRRITIEKPRLA